MHPREKRGHGTHAQKRRIAIGSMAHLIGKIKAGR